MTRWEVPPQCRHRHRRGNPDASLFVWRAVLARAIGAVGRHAGARHGGLPDSARRRVVVSHAGESRHTPPRSRSDPDRSGGRCAPAHRRARTHTTDASRRVPRHSASRHELDKTVQRRHKGTATMPSRRARRKKARGSVRNVPGPSLVGHPGQHNADAALVSPRRRTRQKRITGATLATPFGRASITCPRKHRRPRFRRYRLNRQLWSEPKESRGFMSRLTASKRAVPCCVTSSG
jgi:hypothetical protein